MAKNINLNFDEGYKEYTINNDPERVIRVNTSDFGILTRFGEAYANIQARMDEWNKKQDPEKKENIYLDQLQDMADYVNKQIDYIFNGEVSGIVFGNQSCLSMVKGVPLYERFINAILPVIESDLEEERKASKKRVAEYTKKADKFKNKK